MFLPNISNSSLIKDISYLSTEESNILLLWILSNLDNCLSNESDSSILTPSNELLDNTSSFLTSSDCSQGRYIFDKKLKYSSSDVNYDKARKMAADWDKYGKKEVIISKDNYVEDGATVVEAAKIKNKWVRVLRMNYKHTD